MIPKNPLLPMRAALLPPASRSHTASGLAVAAAAGRFALQVCSDCGATQYPPREACHACLSARLLWRDVPSGGRLLAQTNIRITADPYFRQRAPRRIGTVALDCGPSVIAHLHADVAPPTRVRMALRLDKSGQGVMLALPDATPRQDALMAEFSADPVGRRVLVTDGRNMFGQAMARACLAAGAATVFLGIADPWKPFPGQDSLPGEIVPLDLTDAASVRDFAAGFGGRIDIVINTGLHMRAGGILDRMDLVTTRDEMEAAFLGPLRLAQALGPVLRARGADGDQAAIAWVSVLSATALGGQGAAAASQAAGLSMVGSLRAELRPLRVITALTGPLDDDWHQHIPPPKVTPAALATAIVKALRDGIEEIPVGDVARDLLARWHENPALLAHQLAHG